MWSVVAAMLLGLGLSACSAERAAPTRPLSSTASAVRSSAWFACRSDSDCALVQDATCQFISVNRSYAGNVLKWVLHHPSKRPFKCRGTLDQRHVPSTDYVPLCSDRQCSVTLRADR